MCNSPAGHGLLPLRRGGECKGRTRPQDMRPTMPCTSDSCIIQRDPNLDRERWPDTRVRMHETTTGVTRTRVYHDDSKVHVFLRYGQPLLQVSLVRSQQPLLLDQLFVQQHVQHGCLKARETSQ